MTNTDDYNQRTKRTIQRAVHYIEEAMGCLNGAAQREPGIRGSLHQATYDLDKVITRIKDDASQIN